MDKKHTPALAFTSSFIFTCSYSHCFSLKLEYRYPQVFAWARVNLLKFYFWYYNHTHKLFYCIHINSLLQVHVGMFPIPIDSSAICQTILFIHLNSKQRRVLRKSETIKTPFLYFAYHIECSQYTMKKKSLAEWWKWWIWTIRKEFETERFELQPVNLKKWNTILVNGQLEKNLRTKDSNFNLLTWRSEILFLWINN